VTVSVLAFIPSPAQGVWHLGPVPVRAYALCIIVGIVAALIIGDRRWVARGGEPGVIYDIALWAVPFGLIGGRLYHVITDWQTYFGKDGAGLGAALRIWDGGLGIWGAVALGGVGAWIGCRQRGIPLPAFGDAIAPGIVLAQAIGRLGNYFNQELYGRPTTLPWGLEIYERRDNAGALDSLNGVSTGQLVDVVHPTFLYELLWNLLVFAVLIWVDRRFKIGHGRLFALYVAGYCVGRFWVELMRSDVATHIAGIRINTFTSTFVFVAAVVYIMVAPKGREDPATLKGKDVDAEESVLDELGEELTAVAATSGVVAAAKVAGEDYERDAEPSSAEAFAADIESEAVESEALEESEAGAEAKDLVEQVETAPSENIAEAEAFAAASAAADAAESDAAESDTAEPEEVVEAEGVASEVHEAAAVGADEAEALAEDVGAESETVEAEPESEAAQPESEAEPEEGLGSVEGNEVVEAEAVSSEVHEAAAVGADEAEALAEEVGAESETVEAEPESEAAQPESEAEPEEGLGSVEGDEVVEAEAVASEVHEAAAVGADEAEGVEAEPERESEADDVEPESTAEPEEGLGSVEGDEVVEAEAVASEVHEAAAVGADEAEALAEEVEAEPESEADDVEPESTAEPEEGLGSVEGDEVAAAEEDAPEVHDAAAQAEDVAAEPPRRRWWRRRG
jgi:prolipoprotein diacylglyceryl transferase